VIGVGAPPPVERIVGPQGDEAGRLLRDEEGGEFLETARLAIFDLAAGPDGPPPARKTGWTLFAVMFGATASRGRPAAASDPRVSLRAWVAEDVGRGARVYRTAGGYRLLITAPPLDPAGADSDALLARLGADAATRTACRERGRYRVRARPAAGPGGGKGLAACRFVEAFGRAAEGTAAHVVELHDVATGAHDALPLA